jgi:hypothetical protein
MLRILHRAAILLILILTLGCGSLKDGGDAAGTGSIRVDLEFLSNAVKKSRIDVINPVINPTLYINI